MVSVITTGSPVSMARCAFSIRRRSRTVSIGWCCTSTWRIAVPSATLGRWNSFVKSSPRAFQWAMASTLSRTSERPTASSSFVKPSDARISRTSSATKKK